MAHDKGASGKVGDQKAGRGTVVGREAEFRVEDNVDAGVGRAVDQEREGGVDDPSTLGRLDRVDNDNPLTGAARNTGGLEKNKDLPHTDVSSVEGIRTGGAAASDEPEEEPALSTRTAQSTG